MKIALGILAGILAFNVFVVLAFFAYAIPKRRAVERRRMRLVVPMPPRKPHRRRAIAAAAVAAVLVTGTALANPAARDAVTAMVDTVARGLQIAPAEEVQDAQAGQRIRRQRPSAAVSPSDAPSAKSSQSAAILPSPAGPDGGASSPSGMGADVAPAGPATVTATTTSSSSIVVRWVDVVGETGFRVERSADGVAGWVQVSSTDRDTTVSEDAGLAADTTYYYRVFSTNAGVDSAASAVASATTGLDPASPTTVIAISTSTNSITLDWSDVGNETGYRVESSADGETGWITITTTGQDVTRFVDTDLGSGEVHYYRVFATNAGGDSAPSGVVKAETTGPDPGSPSP